MLYGSWTWPTVLALAALTLGASAQGQTPARDPGATQLLAPVLTPEQIRWYQARLAEQERGVFTPDGGSAAVARNRVAELVLQWDRLRRPAYAASFEELANFLAANPDWPQRRTLQLRAEQALATSTTAGPITRLAYFSRNPPVSAGGRVRYAQALYAQGRTAEAVLQAREAWSQGAVAASDETAILAIAGSGLTPADHRSRLETLLWSGQTTAAQRLLGWISADERTLAQARIALRTDAADIPERLAGVAPSLRGNAGLAFDLARYRRVNRNDEPGAVAALLAATPVAGDIANPSDWANERLRLARPLLATDPQTAYRLVADHGLANEAKDMVEEGADDRAAFIDCEWLAGWTALRRLGRPADALRHFANIATVAQTPISLSRGAYWAGRAAEALGRAPIARQWYNRAAEQSDHFYGQLALEQLGYAVPPVLLERPRIGAAERQRLLARDAVKATALLGQMGEAGLQGQFLRHLTDAARTAPEKILLADYAYAIDRMDLAVMIGKAAGAKGIDLAYAAYPKLDMRSIAEDDWVMVHAISRQESLFNTQAVSSAGARGLMQLMPGTAAAMARAQGLDYDAGRLTQDPVYNMQLGSLYYRQMLERWGGSHVLAIASYNAGPGNVSKWLATLGDPRSPTVDTIDWIERIPFRETRNYVHRVLENAVIYRAIRHSADREPLWQGLGHFLRAGDGAPPVRTSS